MNKAIGIYTKEMEIGVLEKDLTELTEKERREIFKKYAAILEYTEAGKKDRVWLVAINCGNYTYTVKFLWWETNKELPLRYAAIRNNIFDSIMCE